MNPASASSPPADISNSSVSSNTFPLDLKGVVTQGLRHCLSLQSLEASLPSSLNHVFTRVGAVTSMQTLDRGPEKVSGMELSTMMSTLIDSVIEHFQLFEYQRSTLLSLKKHICNPSTWFSFEQTTHWYELIKCLAGINNTSGQAWYSFVIKPFQDNMCVKLLQQVQHYSWVMRQISRCATPSNDQEIIKRIAEGKQEWERHKCIASLLYILSTVKGQDDLKRLIYQEVFASVFDDLLYVEDVLLLLLSDVTTWDLALLLSYIDKLTTWGKIPQAIRVIGMLDMIEADTALIKIIKYCQDQHQYTALSAIETLIDPACYPRTWQYMYKKWMHEGKIQNVLDGACFITDEFLQNEVWETLARQAAGSLYEKNFVDQIKQAPEKIRPRLWQLWSQDLSKCNVQVITVLEHIQNDVVLENICEQLMKQKDMTRASIVCAYINCKQTEQRVREKMERAMDWNIKDTFDMSEDDTCPYADVS